MKRNELQAIVSKSPYFIIDNTLYNLSRINWSTWNNPSDLQELSSVCGAYFIDLYGYRDIESFLARNKRWEHLLTESQAREKYPELFI